MKVSYLAGETSNVGHFVVLQLVQKCHDLPSHFHFAVCPVPMHLEIPYFWHATRYAFPQWLLVVMQDSGLFQTQRLPQVQALVYVHDWRVDNMSDPEQFKQFGGEFVFYPSGVTNLYFSPIFRTNLFDHWNLREYVL